jgi:hypothetical protein
VWFRRRAESLPHARIPGGSVVDQSLLRQAADRGVTICFADLDGADGLWVPEERTVLVNRGLSEAKVAEVIEHELAHVMIDDQHADLDAGKDVLVGRPPSRFRRPQTVALAAVSLFVVVGGAMYGVNAARDGTNRVAPDPEGTGLTAQESGGPKPSLSPSRGPDGRIVYVTVSPTPPTAGTTGSPLDLPSLSPTATKPVPPRTAARTTAGAPPPAQPTTSAPPPVDPTTDPPAPTPTVEPTTPAVPTPPDETGGAGGGTGDQGGPGDTDTVPVVTEQADATVADVWAPVVPGDAATP